MKKKTTLIIVMAGIMIGSILGSIVPSLFNDVQAAGVSPVTIAAQQSAGNFGIGPASIVSSDVTNLRNEANALGVWMDESIQTLQSVCE